jgi:hypothetical protein
VEQIRLWLNNGLQELYFFMHMHDETFSPELSSYLVNKLIAVCGLSLKEPLFISQLSGDEKGKTRKSKKNLESEI